MGNIIIINKNVKTEKRNKKPEEIKNKLVRIKKKLEKETGNKKRTKGKKKPRFNGYLGPSPRAPRPATSTPEVPSRS